MQCKLALRLQKERAKGTFFFTAVCARPFCKGKTTQCSSVFCVNRPLFVTGLFALKQVVVRGTKSDVSFFAKAFGTFTTIFSFFNDVVYGSMQAMFCKTLLFFALLW